MGFSSDQKCVECSLFSALQLPKESFKAITGDWRSRKLGVMNFASSSEG
jgi:hypothetical protein